jgi:antitoxin component of RelBE/YafQ-DinJ toxin-antitoxin module
MSTKDSGLRIRVELELREAFAQACQAQGMVGSEVLRQFMRSFAAKHSSEQASLFGSGGTGAAKPR